MKIKMKNVEHKTRNVSSDLVFILQLVAMLLFRKLEAPNRSSYSCTSARV